MNNSDIKTIEWRVANLDCENEAVKIRRTFEGASGIQEMKVYAKAGKVAFVVDEQIISLDRLKAQFAEAGFPILLSRAALETPKLWTNSKVITAALSGIILGVTFLLDYVQVFPRPIAYILYAAGMLIGGYYFGREAVEALVQKFKVSIEFLMSVAAVAAFALGQPAEALTLVFLYSISEALEGYTEAKTRNAIRTLMDLSPKTATVIRFGQETEISVEEIQVGDRFLVRPGQSIPTDGKVRKGSSSVNQAPITGESIPVEKSVGDIVFAGAINEEGALEVDATKTFRDNTLATIIHLVEEAQEEKGKAERFIKRFGKWYSPAVLICGVLMAVLPGMFGAGWGVWAIRATIFVVAASPCALVISIPIAMVAALGTAARNGVLIKGGIYLEELAKIKVVAFDKTGTLTLGKPEVTDFFPLNEYENETVLSYTVAVERYSQHPLAKAILHYAVTQNVRNVEAKEFRSLTGLGASADVKNKTVYVGSKRLFIRKFGMNFWMYESQMRSLEEQGKTIVLIGDKNELYGVIAIRDRVRPNAQEALQKLRDSGATKIVMLTGDNPNTAKAIAGEVGADEFHADLKPEDKVELIKQLDKKYGKVLMVGDGVNDAPALAAASVGAAMGVAGTDVAMETADVALMGDDLSKLSYVLNLGKRSNAVTKQNLALSMIVISVLVVAAVSGFSTLPVAVLGHELSELAVIVSGLRLLKT